MIDIINQILNLRGESLQNHLSEIIANASAEINEPDIPHLSTEFTNYYKKFLASNHFPALIQIKPGYNEKTENVDIKRIVLVGDLHNDFNSLSTMLYKLSVSDYDYFQKAFFIFTGDYSDRGARPLETLRLLYALKTYLGDRCILLCGNHELISLRNGLIKAEFCPADTSEEIMNKYFNTEINKLYTDYCSRLPFMVTIDNAGKKILVCHGSIPKDEAFPLFNLERMAEIKLPRDEKSVLSLMLKQMVWGDPVDYEKKLQENVTRFEFGRQQFTEFMNKNKFDIFVRSHEPVQGGIRYMFENKLITIFSSGGEKNPDSAYSDEVSTPVFGIIMEDGKMCFESVFDIGVIASSSIELAENSVCRFSRVEKNPEVNTAEKIVQTDKSIILTTAEEQEEKVPQPLKEDKHIEPSLIAGLVNTAKSIFHISPIPNTDKGGNSEKSDLHSEDSKTPKSLMNEEFFIDINSLPKFIK
jgi:hypothetical protein